MRLHYRGNIVTSSRAIVFVCDKLVAQQNKDLPTLTYNNAEERAQLNYDLFANLLAFDMVEICRNQTKAQIIDKLDELKTDAAAFEKTHTL